MLKLLVALACGTLSLSIAAGARAETLQLGTQDFTEGQILPCFSACSSGWTSATDPFNRFLGSDPGIPGATQFSAEWSFDLRTLPIAQLRSLRLEIGLYDHDSSAPGSQIDSFSSAELGDLKALLDTAFESGGRGEQQEYNVLSLELPVDRLGPTGAIQFALRLKGPVWIEDKRTRLPVLAQGTNGAGLDFVRLTLISAADAPEPAGAWLLALAGAALAALRRLG